MSKRKTRARFFGRSECWNRDSTGVRQFYICFIPVWTTEFVHTTGLFD